MKAFSGRLRSEDYVGLLCGVNAHPDDETKVKRDNPTECGTSRCNACTPHTASISHVAWEIDRTSEDWVSPVAQAPRSRDAVRIALVGASRLYSREASVKAFSGDAAP